MLSLGPDPYEDELWRLEVTRQNSRYEILVQLWLEDDQWTHAIDLSSIGFSLLKNKEYKEGIKQISDYIRTQLTSLEGIEKIT